MWTRTVSRLTFKRAAIFLRDRPSSRSSATSISWVVSRQVLAAVTRSAPIKKSLPGFGGESHQSLRGCGRLDVRFGELFMGFLSVATSGEVGIGDALRKRLPTPFSSCWCRRRKAGWHRRKNSCASGRAPGYSPWKRVLTFYFPAPHAATGCLRFVRQVTLPRRKTRFWLLAKLYQAGLVTRRVPSKGFGNAYNITSPSPKLLLAQSASPFFLFFS